MKKRAIKKTKILSCFVVIAILMSAMPVSIVAMNEGINSTSNASNRSNEILLEKANSNFTPIFHTGINQTIDSKEIDSTNNIATVQGEVIPYKEKGEVLFRGEVYYHRSDSWGGVTWREEGVYIKKVLYDPNNYLQGKNSICVLKPEFSYPRMDWGSSDSLVEVYGQYVVGEKDGEIWYTEVRLCEPGEEWGSREYFVRDLTVGDTYKFTGTITYVSRNPSRAGIYSIDLDDSSYGWDWYGEVYFSKTPNGPRIDNVAVGDKAEICGSRHYYNDGRAEIDLITSDHYLKKKDSEPTQFYIRPACQDINGNHLDDVSYEFVDYPTYKGTCDYSEYMIAPGHGTYNVKFTKGDLEATVTLESHSKPFAGTVVTLRKKEGSIYATSTPSGANVYLDGSYKGTSPLTISNVPVGSHTVKYTKTGYKDCVKTVTVYANQQRNVHCYMEEEKFYIRPACQDVNGNHLDEVSYEFVDYPTYKGTCDYSGYLIAPGFGTYKVKFTKGNLEATVTLESHSKTFAGTVVTLRKKEEEAKLCTSPDPPSHDFGTVPEDKTRSWDFDIKNCGGDTLTWSVSDDRSWIKVYPSSGSTTTETDRVTVTIDTYGLSPGECTGHITVTSDDGTKKGTIKVEIPKPLNQPPVANFIYSPSLPLVDQTITFDASDSTDPDGTITSYEWDFGDETTGSGKIITYSYEESKRYQVTLIVTDNEGAKSQFSIEIPVVRIYKLPGGIEVNLLESEYTCNEVKDFYDYEHYYLIAYPLKSVEMFAALARGDAIGALLALKGVAEMDKILKEKRDSAISQLKVLNMPVGMGYFCWSDYFAIYPDQTTPGVAPYFGDFARGTYEFIDGEMQMLIQDIDTFYLYRPGAEYETIGIECPVNATITDQYGRIISDDGTNEIQDADMLIIDETKIFYLPADLRYSVDIDAYGSGTFNFTRVSPIGNDISITKFENIPVTSNTKVSVEIEPGVTDYTMNIDYNGDGVTDEEKSPDVSETIVNVGPENDYAKDSYIKVVSGTIAGQDINPNNPEITVSSAKKISGSFDISVRNTGHSGSIFPIVANPNWGPHESSYWSITGHQAPGIKTHTVNVDINAPSKPGVYYIIVAGQWELSAANVASGTNWVVGENHWNDGNDLADWSTSMIEQAIKSGLVIADWEKVEGMVKMYVPATAIRVKVVTEKTKGWLHSGYDLDNTRFYPYPSETSVTNFDISWTSTNKGKILTGDINGDGELELVSAFEERVYTMDKNGALLWSNNVATDSGISGAKVKSMDLADMDGDNIPEIVVGISSAVPYPGVNKPLRILFYDGAGNLLKTISTPDSHVIAVKCADLNNDGRKEVIVTIQAWYTLKPRGVYVYDYNTGNELWHYNIGPQLWIDSIADINNDGYSEIIIGTFAPHNGNSDYGTDDSHSYVFAFDKEGNILWTKQIGWDSVYSSVADLNNDGNPEIISFRNQNEPYYPGPNDVYILNPANGNIVDTYNGPANKGWRGWAIADINGNGKKEVVVGNRDGTLRVLDYNLNLIDSCSLSGMVQAINDVNGDGKQEIIVCTDDKRIVILNDDLSEAGSYELGAKGNAIVSDLIPGGANELIVSVDKLYVFSGIEGSIPGDVTGDGMADYKDLVVVIEHWGAIDIKYDVDRNGAVGYSDIWFIIEHWTGSKPYRSAITCVQCPYVADELCLYVCPDSSFKVQITTDGTVEAAHISVSFPSELKIESINVDPYDNFDFADCQNGTNWVDVIVANYRAPLEAPTLAEIGFTATEEGTYTINLSSVINGGCSITANMALAKAPNVEISIDTESPIVSDITVSPTSAKPGTLIYISAKVFDSSGVKWVRTYINKDGELVTTVFMSDSDGDGIYTGTWQMMNFTESGIYSIDISATDTDGNEALAKGPEIEIT